MKFKFYYNLEISNNTYKYYKLINETNIKSAKNKFFDFINEKYSSPTKIEIVKIEKINNDKIYEIKEGEK